MSDDEKAVHIRRAIDLMNCCRAHLYGAPSAVGLRELNAAARDFEEAANHIKAALSLARASAAVAS